MQSLINNLLFQNKSRAEIISTVSDSWNVHPEIVALAMDDDEDDIICAQYEDGSW